MKTNKMMRIASVLLVVVLLSTCAISGTFAKYTADVKGTTQTARVAKWGVTITSTGTMFAKSYNETGSTTVESAAEVVAPGTSGSFAGVKISGSPEVATVVSHAATVDVAGFMVEDQLYFPLTVTVNDTAVDFSACTTAAEVATAIKTAIESYTKSYAPGATIEDADNLKVDWEWAFDGNDTKDTALGDSAESNTISIKIDSTIAQVN